MRPSGAYKAMRHKPTRRCRRKGALVNTAQGVGAISTTVWRDIVMLQLRLPQPGPKAIARGSRQTAFATSNVTGRSMRS